MKVSIVIPVFNEESTIESVVKGIQNLKLATDIIVVDDGSTDSSLERIKCYDVKIIRHTFNQGYGSALISGINHSIKNKSDITVFMDSDGQHNPSYIPSLIQPILDGKALMVIGSRFLNKTDVPFARKLVILTINKIIWLATRQKLTDTQSGFRAFKTEILPSLNLKASGMGFSIEILTEVIKKNYPIKELPISCDYDKQASSLNKIKHLSQLVKSLLPLVFFTKKNP